MSVYAKEYGYFFNSNNSDRKYNASSFEEWLKPFFLTGVFNGELQVTAQPTPDMTVNVAPGHANLDGKPAYWDGANTIAIDTASGVYPRIDTIVLRRDNVNRACSIEYVKGVASISPQPVAPTRNADTYELVLAQILVGVGVTEIVDANITDTRMDSDLCGWVAATVDQIDFDQIKTQFDSWMEVNQTEFEDWFQHLRDELDDNQAAHLQNEIDELMATIAPNSNAQSLYYSKYYYDYNMSGDLKLYEYVASGPTGSPLNLIEAIRRIVGDLLAITTRVNAEKTADIDIEKGQFVYLWKYYNPAWFSPGLVRALTDIPRYTELNVSNVEPIVGFKGALNLLQSQINDTNDKIIPQKVIVDATSKTVRNYHIPNSARCFIVGSAGLSANHFCIIINSHPTNGSISKAEVYKGSNVTITTDTNKLIVTTGSTDLSLYVFAQDETKIDDIYLMS